VPVEVCDECRFDGSAYTRDDARGTLRATGVRWRWTIEDVDPALLTRRPEPGVWSIVEYVDHSATIIEAMSRLLHGMTTTGVEPFDAPEGPLARADDPPTTKTIDEVLARLDANVARLDAKARSLRGDAWATTVVVDGHTWPADEILRHAAHDSTHHLMDGGRLLVALGARKLHGTGGVVAGLFANRGGPGKLPITEATIGYRGVAGDRQQTRFHHGRVSQALCLWSAEVVRSLQAEGHPVAPGSTGENVSLEGAPWTDLHAGMRLGLGDDVLIEISGYALPCKKNAPYFLGGDFRRMDPDRHPGWSRLYASVLRDGVVRPGDPVVIEPG
jgi:MOSC domain-containing protein YiiM